MLKHPRGAATRISSSDEIYVADRWHGCNCDLVRRSFPQYARRVRPQIHWMNTFVAEQVLKMFFKIMHEVCVDHPSVHINVPCLCCKKHNSLTSCGDDAHVNAHTPMQCRCEEGHHVSLFPTSLSRLGKDMFHHAHKDTVATIMITIILFIRNINSQPKDCSVARHRTPAAPSTKEHPVGNADNEESSTQDGGRQRTERSNQ